MPEEWLIDGYNFLHDIRLPRKPVPSRESFFARIADFAAQGDRQVWMVLDGKGRDEEFASFRTPFFRPVFSGEVSADAFIERRLAERRDKTSLFVVTRDRAVGDMACGFGAVVVAPSRFLESLRETGKAMEEVKFRHDVKAHGFHRPFDKKLGEAS